MTALAEASMLVRDLALPVPPGDTTKAAIRRAWRRVQKHFTSSRIKDIWYADTRAKIGGDELRVLREAARQRQEEDDARTQLRHVRTLLERIEAHLEADANARGSMASQAGPRASAVDRTMVGRGADR